MGAREPSKLGGPRKPGVACGGGRYFNGEREANCAKFAQDAAHLCRAAGPAHAEGARSNSSRRLLTDGASYLGFRGARPGAGNWPGPDA